MITGYVVTASADLPVPQAKNNEELFPLFVFSSVGGSCGTKDGEESGRLLALRLRGHWPKVGRANFDRWLVNKIREESGEDEEGARTIDATNSALLARGCD